ncbi:MAG: trifunctional transcriptional activator/DNA repair protein Ada/methylated-DNA--[protein]-cysteine S-methyltransferase [Chloroflexi bacterium]|nr:trifunctional transcriptional activator/DNA repair protein Ada/methylated-DNA--[protein]-cysteine S-methyltransferase [Chloroflexota bacterium]
MITTHHEYYQAMLDKNSEYEGIFYVGVKTTGVFCRPGCPVRKPKFENCEFFETAAQALLAGYRPCKRCHPLSSHLPETIQQLLNAVEAQPDKKWHSEDVRALHIDPSTARRQFKKRFGITFIEYARARRMGLALKEIQNGSSVIEAQVSAGYESGSGFRDAFASVMGTAPSAAEHQPVLESAIIETKLGSMLAIASDDALHLLEFADRRGLERAVERLRKNAAIVPGRSGPIDQIEAELQAYFAGKLAAFTTPVALNGTDFQQKVWQALCDIPCGETRSYAELAAEVGKPSAVRAVAQANGANQLAIIIPCHRVINADGKLGGYGGGLVRKKWLIEHEQGRHS